MRTDTGWIEVQSQASSSKRAAVMSPHEKTILASIELSNTLWLVGTRLPGAEKCRMHRIKSGDTAALLALLEGLRTKHAGLSGEPVPICCCFEAGRDGFWLHRLLTAHDIPTYVVEPASILVNRRAMRAKTDRIDAEGLIRVLATYIAGDSRICSMVRVPTIEEEDGKRVHREREYLVQERIRIENRILALLATQAFGHAPRCGPGIVTWPFLRPATVVRCRTIFGPSSAACASAWF